MLRPWLSQAALSGFSPFSHDRRALNFETKWFFEDYGQNAEFSNCQKEQFWLEVWFLWASWLMLCAEFCIVLQIFSLCNPNNFVHRLSAGLCSGPTCSTGAGTGAARADAAFQHLSPSCCSGSCLHHFLRRSQMYFRCGDLGYDFRGPELYMQVSWTC